MAKSYNSDIGKAFAVIDYARLTRQPADNLRVDCHAAISRLERTFRARPESLFQLLSFPVAPDRLAVIQNLTRRQPEAFHLAAAV